MTKKLYVRYAEPSDEKAVFDFYAENKHDFVFQRDPEVWKERIASGAVTIIHDEAGKIVASSISYPVTEMVNGQEVHKWTEIGSTRVALEGIGLFNALISAQVVRAYLFEPPEDRFCIEIIKGNEHSKHVFVKAGCVPYNPPDGFLKKCAANIVNDDPNVKVDWFQMGVEAVPPLAQMMLDKMASGRVVNKKTGEEYEFDFSRCVVASKFKDALKDLAGKDFGDVKQPNQRHGMKSFRDKFHP